MDEYCKEKGFAAWFETSAKEDINIDEAAKCLIQKVNPRSVAFLNVSYRAICVTRREVKYLNSVADSFKCIDN